MWKTFSPLDRYKESQEESDFSVVRNLERIQLLSSRGIQGIPIGFPWIHIRESKILLTKHMVWIPHKRNPKRNPKIRFLIRKNQDSLRASLRKGNLNLFWIHLTFFKENPKISRRNQGGIQPDTRSCDQCFP